MSCKDMITPAQIRAARALLGWTRQKLANESGVGHATLADYESGRTGAMLSTSIAKIADTFAAHNVVFIDRVGVRFKEEPGKEEPRK